MSNVDRSPEDALATLELFQGLPRPASPEERLGLYELFGEPDESWTVKAERAYAAMSRTPGIVASVGDQLAAELDISTHADLYAAVGGFDVSEITHGLGTWWSPSARWFELGRDSQFRESIDEVDQNFDAIAKLLLDAGAESLTNFFSRIAAGAAKLAMRHSFPLRRKRNREFAFVTLVAAERAKMFRDGPDDYGRYLRDDEIDEEVLASRIVASLRRGASRMQTKAPS